MSLALGGDVRKAGQGWTFWNRIRQGSDRPESKVAPEHAGSEI